MLGATKVPQIREKCSPKLLAMPPNGAIFGRGEKPYIFLWYTLFTG